MKFIKLFLLIGEKISLCILNLILHVLRSSLAGNNCRCVMKNRFSEHQSYIEATSKERNATVFICRSVCPRALQSNIARCKNVHANLSRFLIFRKADHAHSSITSHSTRILIVMSQSKLILQPTFF